MIHSLKKIPSTSFIFFIFFVFFFTNLIYPLFGAGVTFWSDIDNDELARTIVEGMTDKELYSQALMFGWAGKEPGHLLYDWVGEGLGSVKIFGWNTDDLLTVAKTVSELQRAAKKNRFQIPLFVATDQEGGWVRHVKGETSITPGNMAIGSSGTLSDAWKSAYYINCEIKALGINMNFSPTVDLFTNKDSTIIGTRSFSSDPDFAAQLAVAYTRGVRAAGVIPTGKHFPGHGATGADSHIKFPVIDATRELLFSRELVPFKALIDDGLEAIMSGHLAFPKVDSERPLPPASLSHYMLTTLLKGELGFGGLIITDDMMMNGVTSFAVLSKAYYLALMAGNDILISSQCAKMSDPLWTKNLSLLKTDKAFRARVKEAVKKIILIKLRYFKGGSPAPLFPNPADIKKYIPDPEGKEFFLEEACRALVMDKRGTVPLTQKSSGRTLLVSNVDSFFHEGKRNYKNSGEFRYTYDLGPIESLWMSEHIGSTAKNYDTIIICVSNERTLAIARALKPLKKRVVVFLLNSPQYKDELSWADTILTGFSTSPYTIEALFCALRGDFVPEGKRPF